MTHGGLLSMLLDEAMAHACLGEGRMGVTAELTVRFRKPVETGSSVRIFGEVSESRGRMLRTRGRIEDAAGVALAEATATFISTVV